LFVFKLPHAIGGGLSRVLYVMYCYDYGDGSHHFGVGVCYIPLFSLLMFGSVCLSLCAGVIQ